MKKLFLLSVAATLISSLSFATIRRVGYPGQALAGVDFTSIDLAVADIDDTDNISDTLQIYGNANSGTITKKLVIIGYGYNLAQNPNLNAIGSKTPSSLSITLSEGSSGTKIIGCYVDATIAGYADASATIENISFERTSAYISFYDYVSYAQIRNISAVSSVVRSIGSVYQSKPVPGILLANCYIESGSFYGAGCNVLVQNCVSPYGGNIITVAGGATAVIENSIGYYAQDVADIVYNRCVFVSAAGSNTMATYNNCLFNQPWENIYTFNGGTYDQGNSWSQANFDEDYYRLKTGSPAIGFGRYNGNAVDCGIFAGDPAFVYKIGGVPPVPAIYQLTAPNINASSNPYNVTISVRSNN